MNAIEPRENTPKPRKERRISRRIRHAVEALVRGDAKTQTQAAEQAGLARETLCRALKDPAVRALLDRRVKESIATSQAPAMATLLDLLANASSEHVTKDVAPLALLRMNGHVPPENGSTLVNLEIKAGWVVDLSEPGKSQLVGVNVGAPGD